MLSRETDADSYKHTKLDYHATVREMPSRSGVASQPASRLPTGAVPITAMM